MTTKEEVSRQFGKNARQYALSPGHARGADLKIVFDLLKPEPFMRVLDVATGAGHTAAMVAPYVKHVTAVDLAQGMIDETEKLFAERGIANADARVMDVEALQFPDASFDAVTCRIAPHHFIDIGKAVSEISRVLKQGGIFVLEDSCAPGAKRLDRFINDLERIRDHTHVRSYTKAQWKAMLYQCGLFVTVTRNYRKTHDVTEWMDHVSLDEDGRKLTLAAFAAAPDWARKHFKIVFEGDRAVSYTDDKVILKAVKL